MNNLSAITLFDIRKRLKHWAHWNSDVLSMGLTYSRRNVLAAAIDSQGDIIKSTRRKLAPENESAEIIDALINAYAVKHSKEAKALTIHYLNKDRPLKEKIALAKLPKTTYFRYIDHAEAWLIKQLFQQHQATILND